MNHKGLVTFDRQVKKDSFYLYKAWWSENAFVHICGKRYVNRETKATTVKVYSNCPVVTLYADGRKIAEQQGKRVFTFRVKLGENTHIKAAAGECTDEVILHYVNKPDPSYRLGKTAGGENWTKREERK